MFDDLSLFQPLLEHSKTVYFAYDLDSRRVLYLSAAYEQVIGDPTTHINEDLPYLLARVNRDDWQQLGQLLAQATPQELVQDVDVRLAQAGGRTQWLSLTVCRRPALGRAGAQLVGYARDVTQEKNAVYNAQKFSMQKDATLEALSHDLAAPLVLLQQLTEHLSWEMTDASDKVQQLLSLMQRTCAQSVTLIRDFVDGEFLESANVRLKRERTDLIAWLRLVVDEYQRSKEYAQLTFSFAPAEEPMYVSFDTAKLRQVMNNLLANASKFTPDGGRIAVAVARRGAQVLLSVADSGIGIPAALQPGLFEKFTKSRRPGLRGEKTTGLGMSAIRAIMDLHQGRVWLDSAEGQGATFFLEFPILLV